MELVKTLSSDEVGLIQEKTAAILEEIGIGVTHPRLLRLCREAGAQVDEAVGRVRFSRTLLHDLLASAPSSYEVAGANGQHWTIGGGEPFCTAIVTDPWIVDYATGLPRRPCLADVRRHTIVAQRLAPVAAISLMDFPVTDVPEPNSSLRAFEEHVLYHDKHILVYATDLERYGHWLEVGRILAGGRDLAATRLFSVAVGMLSPLAISNLNADFLLSACEHNFPVIPTVCPMAGMTSPFSLASTLLQGNVELIGLCALVQIVRRGHPMLYAFGPSTADLRSTHDLYYTLEKVLWKIGAVQIGHAYGLPAMAECGGSMTHRYDQQNGAEGMTFMLAALGSGADLLSGIGSTYNAVGMSGEMMLIQDAWLAAARYLRQGMRVDEDQLGLASMAAAGPRGNFLTDDLTLRNLRSGEFFGHKLLDYSGASEASLSLIERAHHQLEAWTAQPVSPLPAEVQARVHEYFAAQYRTSEGLAVL